MDYSPVTVRALLVYWEEAQQIKYRLTYDLTEDAFTASSQDDFYAEEGHTLFSRSPRTTRIPKNTNSRNETLCVMTADVEVALKTVLTFDERTVLILKAYAENEAESKGEITPDESALYLDESFQKVVDYLNGY